MSIIAIGRTLYERKIIRLYILCLIVSMCSFSGFSQQLSQSQNTQVPYLNTQSFGNENNSDSSNYSTNSPFKTEVARLEAFVYRNGKESLPLMQVPRLNKGDVLKIKLSNEAVNGVTPDQSNWDWTLLVAFINPSRNQNKDEVLSEEIRLRETGWYKDYFFTVPYDSQPIIFLYPKGKYRNKILNLIQKKPDEVRQMGEKVIEISGAYAQLSSFLNQLQTLMVRDEYNNGYYGSYGSYGNGFNTPGKADSYVEQSVEGLARSFNVQLPSCWNNMNYAPMSQRAQCVSKNVRLEDLNFSVSRMLQQGGLFALNQLRQAHPELGKWIALAAVAIDFILKLTGKVGIRIIPAIVSSADSPLYFQNNYSQFSNVPVNYSSQGIGQNSFASNSSKVSLYANSQPNDRDFVTVYAFVPHKWQPDADPSIYSIFAPKPTEPCMRAGKNILRNSDLRLDWLADSFTRNFKLILSDKNGWTKEFELRKNLGLNAWEADISKEELNQMPRTGVPFDAKITGNRGFNEIESPVFKLSISNGGNWEANLIPSGNGKSKIVLRKVSGDIACSQNVSYKVKNGQQIILPLARDNNFIKFSSDPNEVSFEIDAANSQAGIESIEVQQFDGDKLPVSIKP